MGWVRRGWLRFARSSPSRSGHVLGLVLRFQSGRALLHVHGIFLKSSGHSSGYGSKLNHQGIAGCNPWFHLPGFYFGYLFLTHSLFWLCVGALITLNHKVEARKQRLRCRREAIHMPFVAKAAINGGIRIIVVFVLTVHARTRQSV